jgi:hypothetical protein
MATEVLTPIADGTNTAWSPFPGTPTTRFSKIDEGYLLYDVADYVYTGTNNAKYDAVYSIPLARNIDAVSSIRVYFPFYGLLGASSGMAVTLAVYGAGVLKGSITVDADTAGLLNLAYVDISVSGFGQAEADAVVIRQTFLLNPGGGPYPEPDIYAV